MPGGKNAKGAKGTMKGGKAMGFTPGVQGVARPPKDGPPSDNLYCIGMPIGTEQSTVEKIFEPFGKVTAVKLLTQPGAHDQACMVRMTDVDEATAALNGLNGKMVPWGQRFDPLSLEIKYAGKDPEVASDNLYFRGLPPGVQEDGVKEWVQTLPDVSMQRCKVMPGSVGRGSAALVQFATQEEAAGVIASLNGKPTPDHLGPILKVHFALEKKDREASAEGADGAGGTSEP